MPRHQDADATFDTPDGWQDRTLVAHASTTDTANFVMTRDPIRAADTLRGHVDRQLLQLGKQLKDFELVESGEMTVGGLPAVTISYIWLSPSGRLEQTLTVIERVVGHERVATSFTTTSSAEAAPKARFVFDAILKSVRFTNSLLQSAPPASIPPSSGPVRIGIGLVEAPTFPMPGVRSEGRR